MEDKLTLECGGFPTDKARGMALKSIDSVVHFHTKKSGIRGMIFDFTVENKLYIVLFGDADVLKAIGGHVKLWQDIINKEMG